MEIKYKSLEELKNHPVFLHFLNICQIPHPSFKEELLGNYICEWANDLGLETEKNKAGNVMIRKPATPGYEVCDPVLLQAHIDMVCEKAPGVIHDFETDEILPILEGDILSTGGRTTLGADNGIGAAYIMALLESKEIPHPPLEALFTTAEEADFSGALSVDGDWFQARYLINLDYAKDDSVLCGSCGGNGARLTIPVEYKTADQKGKWFELTIAGMPGGHSGEDIHRGHGNAGALMARLLNECRKTAQIGLASLHAGHFRLALPRDAHAGVWVDARMEPAFLASVEETKRKFIKQYGAVAPNLVMEVNPIDASDFILTDKSLRNVLYALYLSPNGISEMNAAMPEVVESSDNMGEINLDQDGLHLVYEIRTLYETTKEFLNDRLRMIAELLDGEYQEFAEYPSWIYEPQSTLLQKAQDVYLNQYGAQLTPVVFHAGVESGCLLEKIPGMEAIGLGSNAWGFHSPYERVSVSSTEKVYEFLTVLLGAMKK